MNLIANARDAIGQKNGTIVVSLSELAQGAVPASVRVGTIKPGRRYAAIAVEDTGTGMDEGTIRKIFDPFFTTKPLGQGTGLGLSITHEIVRAHNGAIGLESKPGSGAAFTVYLPLS